MTVNPLFEAAELSELVDEDVSDAKLEVVERLVWGWVSDALGLAEDAERPAELSEKLWSWSVELGAIAYENPKGLLSYQLGEERSQYGSERRAELLELVAGSASSSTSGYRPGPRYTGPRCSEPYPDPARGRAYAPRLREGR